MKNVPEKANRVLNILLLAFVLIAIRIFYLAILKHEDYKEFASNPKQKTILEFPHRGTIRDRFNIPLAVNKIQYDAAIIFDPMRIVPRVKWVKDPSGKRKKIFARKEYISKLANFLGNALEIEPLHIEDMIYSKVSLFPNTPFVLKENVSEELYYRLHIQEKEWPGLAMQISSRRYYPKGPLASNILGYISHISDKEFLSVQRELSLLKKFLKSKAEGEPAVLPQGYSSTQEVKERYLELKNKCYTPQSKVGKAGVEGKFDDQLRGLTGKKKYEIDVQGNPLRELPESYPATPGRRIILNLSSELQELAETLLMESELTRHERFPTAGKDHGNVFSPWIKGGAIIAMIPKTGEIVACASYPRFDPNDFASKGNFSVLMKWLETPHYIGQIWDGIKPLEREFGSLSKPTIPLKALLSLDLYLNMLLATKSEVKQALALIKNLQTAIFLQNAVETLFHLSEEPHLHTLIDTLFPKEKGHVQTFFRTPKEKQAALLQKLHQKTSLLPELTKEMAMFLEAIPENDDKILTLDLIRLIVPGHLFDDALLAETGRESLSAYREFNQAVMSVQGEIKKIVKEIFHKEEFTKWRKEHFPSYLAQKRTEEALQKIPERPYIDYLHEIEETLFENFFGSHRFDFLSIFLLDNAPLDPSNPCFIYYNALIEHGLKEKTEACLLLKNHLLTLSEASVIPYLNTMRSFKELNRPLWGRYYFPAKAGKEATEQDLARHFYPTPGFGFSRSFAFQETAPLGSIFKIVTGYEGIRQHYLKHQEKPHLALNPLTLIDQSPPPTETLSASSILGYTINGVPITRIYKGGRIPRGHLNIGKIDLRGALERSSNLYFALLASDVLENPLDLTQTAKMVGFGKKTGIDLLGEAKGFVPQDTLNNPTALYALSIGQHSLTVTPLQTACFLSTLANGGKLLKPQIVKTIANFEPKKGIDFLFSKQTFLRDYLSNAGIYFPVFTEAEEKPSLPFIWHTKPEVHQEIFLPETMRAFLMEGLYDVVNGARGTARSSAIKTLRENPHLKQTYDEIKPYLAGKTSTAEILFRPFLDRGKTPVTCKHIWFGGLGLTEKNPFSDSDLVIVISLRFADNGKEAAPLAAEILKKWREICSRVDNVQLPQ